MPEIFGFADVVVGRWRSGEARRFRVVSIGDDNLVLHPVREREGEDYEFERGSDGWYEINTSNEPVQFERAS
jgi:hypothetical protein